MPSAGRPKFVVRMDGESLALLRAEARKRNIDTSTLAREVLEWWLGVEGAELPERPDE